MSEVSGISSSFAKGARRGLIAVASFAVAALVLYFLYLALVQIHMADDGSFQRWLKSPVSEMKVWHLIAILLFFSAISSNNSKK